MADGKTDTATPATALSILRLEFAVGGFGFGMTQEFLKATVALPGGDRQECAALDDAFSGLIPASGEEAGETAGSVLDRIIRWTAELQRAGGQPVFGTGKVVLRAADTGRFILALPTMNPGAAEKAFRLTVRIAAGLLDGAEPAGTLMDTARAEVDAYVKAFSAKATGGSNTDRFLKAAHEARIPWFRVTGSIFQFGMGSKARWLDSSFTDQTPVIASNIARNKIAAAEVLRGAGLPVPAHAAVGTAKEAARIARNLGYPVVVKPANKDGGVGVSAGLKDEAAVLKAFDAARRFSTAVMVEKHVDGRDYRLVVFGGKLIWALERVPGGVTGDGVSSVRQLVERVNAEPARAKRANAPLKPLEIDDEMQDLLAEYGMSLDSVVEAGRWLRLRRAANVASGGTPQGVFEQVHPDNALLAERAARTLRLDIAGIDLLIPDIGRSWMETGAAICEVNAQPTIGNTTSAHLYGQILKALVPQGGRVPIALIVGAGDGSAAPDLVARILAGAGLRTGVATRRRVTLDGRVLSTAPENVFMAARSLIADTGTDAVVVSASDMSVARTYMAFDRCTVVAMAGVQIDGKETQPGRVMALARILLPLSFGAIVLNADEPDCLAMAPSLNGAKLFFAGAGAGIDAARGHEKAGGRAVVVEGGPEAPRLVIGGESIDLGEIAAGGPALRCTLDDIVIAASTALAMGASLAQVGQGLRGARWTAGAGTAA
jgi:cyanophycin synthetase